MRLFDVIPDWIKLPTSLNSYQHGVGLSVVCQWQESFLKNMLIFNICSH